ncbi:hypothetical protein [Herbaspirillum robiniae]|uniref:Uncharacterized protein n=1 Tax=Herbaspirillum robiniae TaxID=2014887 RepID=A0A246WUE7_9BURK|nr:hypothetical protein [Herbaspirillum robiniae]OWY30663.1 hypothetical protein CEJ42_00870 [Herbaspirillum robiniae]
MSMRYTGQPVPIDGKRKFSAKEASQGAQSMAFLRSREGKSIQERGQSPQQAIRRFVVMFAVSLALGASPMAQAQYQAAPAAPTSAERDALLEHLRLVIPDETRKVAPKVLSDFVNRYLQRAKRSGLDDVNRQTYYLLLALYTSGKGIERPEVKALMAHPPVSDDAFNDALTNLPQAVWESGKPLWDTAAAP